MKKKLESKFFIYFIKIFLIYIFLEYFLSSLSQNQIYQQIIKFFGDFLILVFVIYTLFKYRKIKVYKEQRLSLLLLFFVVAIISTIKNQLNLLNLALGLRSLFRYYIIYFFSYYYNIDENDFKNISSFIINSFYIEIILFFVSVLFFNTTNVLNQSYLVQALYLNAIFSLILFNNKLDLKNYILIVLIIIQSFISTSRLALIGLAIQGIIFIFIILKKRVITKITIILLILLIITTIMISPINTLIINSEQYKKLNDLKIDSEPDTNFRLFLFYHFTKISIENNNILGDGPNTFGSLYTRQYNKEYYYKYGFTDYTIPFAADSDYTNILMQYGFLGLMLFYLFILILYLNVNNKYKPLFLMYLSFIFLASFAIPVFSMRISSFLVFILFGLTYNIKKYKSEGATAQ